MKPIDKQTKLLALKAYASGKKAKDVASFFQVDIRTIFRWSAINKAGGELCKKRNGRPPSRFNSEDKQKLSELVEQQPDITLEELKEAFGNHCHISTISRALSRLGYRYKKNTKSRRTEST
jgi:transposase